MSPLMEEQQLAEGELCHAIYRLIIGHRFSAYEVRDVVDTLSGQFYRNPGRWRSANPSPIQRAIRPSGWLAPTSLGRVAARSNKGCHPKR